MPAHRLDHLDVITGSGPTALRSLLAGARLVPEVTAGIALRTDGGCQPLPGLRVDQLLTRGSPVVAAARRRLRDVQITASFLWPRGGDDAPEGHARVTVLSGADDAGAEFCGLALLSRTPWLRGLTPRELQVLGLLVEGRTNADIAHVLVVTARTVATHLEHILAMLGAPTRTLAAVQAARDGLYVPAEDH